MTISYLVPGLIDLGELLVAAVRQVEGVAAQVAVPVVADSGHEAVVYQLGPVWLEAVGETQGDVAIRLSLHLKVYIGVTNGPACKVRRE